MNGEPLLEITGLQAGYGKLQVVFGASLRVETGEWVALTGRNGVGKTTTLLATSGLMTPLAGSSVRVAGVETVGMDPAGKLRVGLGVVPAGRRIFRSMTVRENLRLGAFASGRKARRECERRMEEVFTVFPPLRDHIKRVAGALSGGQQQMVALGQALMSDPRVVLLDEPYAGLAPTMVDAINDSIGVLTSNGVGVLVVDEVFDRALAQSKRCYVMDAGEIVLHGQSDALARDKTAERIVVGLESTGEADSWRPESGDHAEHPYQSRR